MFNKFVPKQPNETTDEFVARVEEDAIRNKEARIEILKTTEDREERRKLLNKLTGLAIKNISQSVSVFCADCGKEEVNEPLYCRNCGGEDYLEVWHLKTGECYITAEDFLDKAKNVQIMGVK